ncbi:S100 calcium binding protein U [Parambassis ranga]|uniref:S100 calcium binding protein U n=1 Tax=Parambassis ranga TaxID=210632 RepID=A0A6P7HWQ2_9TELE|nr:coiled-coil domain-containing protein 8 homolog [Parambassis ranga]
MESAIQTLAKVFLKSSKGKDFLGKKEFQNLVSTQLSNILSDTDSKEAVSNMGQGLDADQDGKVGFEEYMKLVGYLAVSLSEQRNIAKEEPEQNSASAQVSQSTPNKEEAKEGAKPEVNEEPKAEATAEVKVEANAEVKVEASAKGETQPKVAKEEPATMAAVVAAAVVAAATEAVAVKEEEKAEVAVKTEEGAEKPATEEEEEEKTEEATS